MSKDSRAQTRDERFEHGMEVLTRVDGPAGRHVIESLADISPELGHQIAAWGFGEMYDRPTLTPRDRQLVTLGILTALGGCEPQLNVHVNAALNVGRPRGDRRGVLALSGVLRPPQGSQRDVRGEQGLR